MSLTKNQPTNSLSQRLVEATIGGNRAGLPESEIEALFGEYLVLAYPELTVQSLELVRTAASLNSIAAFLEFSYQNQTYQALAKVHIESATTTRVTSAAGVAEYQNAQWLSQSGWPVLEPFSFLPINSEYPVLLYPRVTAPTLFDLLAESHARGRNLLGVDQLQVHEDLTKTIGQVELRTLERRSTTDFALAANSPIQHLFWERLKPGGRLDQWYLPDTELNLPGLKLTWAEILGAKWQINGVTYETTLGELIDRARDLLSFRLESETAGCVAHGDDHAGNVFVDVEAEQGLVFDPAFAGLCPAALAGVKALAHTGVLPLGGMYYDPGIPFNYTKDLATGRLVVEGDWSSSAVAPAHEALARQIIDYRILPVFRQMRAWGLGLDQEVDRLRYALAVCAFLVIHVGKLLNRPGYGQGLWPLAILLANLDGLPQLEYLNQQLAKV